MVCDRDLTYAVRDPAPSSGLQRLTFRDSCLAVTEFHGLTLKRQTGRLSGHIGGTSVRDLPGNDENCRYLSSRSDDILSAPTQVRRTLAQDPAYRPTHHSLTPKRQLTPLSGSSKREQRHRPCVLVVHHTPSPARTRCSKRRSAKRGTMRSSASGRSSARP